MNLHDIRRNNLKSYLKLTLKRGDFSSRDEFVVNAGLTPSQLSQLFMDPNKSGHRNLGETLARKIESNLGLVPYYLDNKNNINFDDLTISEHRSIDNLPALVLIPFSEYFANDDAEFHYMVDRQLEQLGLPADGESIVAIYNSASNMRPTLSKGDVLLADAKRNMLTQQNTGELFAFIYDQQPCLGRLHLNVLNQVSCSFDSISGISHPMNSQLLDSNHLEIIGQLVWRSGALSQ